MSLKKRVFTVLAAVVMSVVLALTMTACGEEEKAKTGDSEPTQGQVVNAATPTGGAVAGNVDGPVTEIQEFIRDRVNAEFTPTTVGSITVNPDNDGGYDVNVSLNWRKEDQEPVVRATIGLYSDTLANEVATHLDSVKKLSVTWTLTTVDNKLAQWNFNRSGNVLKLESKKYGDVEKTQ